MLCSFWLILPFCNTSHLQRDDQTQLSLSPSVYPTWPPNIFLFLDKLFLMLHLFIYTTNWLLFFLPISLARSHSALLFFLLFPFLYIYDKPVQTDARSRCPNYFCFFFPFLSHHHYPSESCIKNDLNLALNPFFTSFFLLSKYGIRLFYLFYPAISAPLPTHNLHNPPLRTLL